MLEHIKCIKNTLKLAVDGSNIAQFLRSQRISELLVADSGSVFQQTPVKVCWKTSFRSATTSYWMDSTAAKLSSAVTDNATV